MELPDALLAMALDLTASLAAKDRLARVLESVRGALPCDAAAVLELVGDELVPLATHGLAPEVLGRRFARREHPRLDLVLARRAPVRFAADSALFTKLPLLNVRILSRSSGSASACRPARSRP